MLCSKSDDRFSHLHHLVSNKQKFWQNTSPQARMGYFLMPPYRFPGWYKDSCFLARHPSQAVSPQTRSTTVPFQLPTRQSAHKCKLDIKYLLWKHLCNEFEIYEATLYSGGLIGRSITRTKQNYDMYYHETLETFNMDRGHHRHEAHYWQQNLEVLFGAMTLGPHCPSMCLCGKYV